MKTDMLHRAASLVKEIEEEVRALSQSPRHAPFSNISSGERHPNSSKIST